MIDLFATDSSWKTVKIGGGGMATGIDTNADGTLVCRTDGAGAFLWNGTSWVQLVNAATMPAGTSISEGVYEIRIAPSNSNIFYMETGGNVYKSVDRGQSWTKTAFTNVFMDANGERRADGQKMAIDPLNPDVVFVGTQKDGLFVTRDGGTTWQKITAIPSTPTTNDGGLTGILIRGNTVFVGTDGNGVFRSDDGGRTWAKTNGGPLDVSHAAIAANGDVYATNTTDETLWKYSNYTWTKMPVSNVHAVAIDPFNPAHVLITNWTGQLQQSTDGGTTWQGWAGGWQLDAANDVPWLAQSGNYMTSSAIIFDPLQQGKVYQAAGVGVWNTTLTNVLNYSDNGTYQNIVWHSQTSGIENLVANDILAPAGGDPIFASWDRPFFTEHDLDSYATSYSGGVFSMGWSIDYASSNPSFIVGLSDWFGQENSGFSSDGGKTWQKFAGYPTWANDTVGGCIAASTPENFVWVAAGAGGVPPAYTLDGGKTWTNITIAGVTDWSGLDSAYYLKRTVITADRVQPNTFYLYDTNSGVYATHDGGVNWQKVYSGQVAPWSGWSVKMEAVPGQAGELFFTSGDLAGDMNISLMHSRDGGAHWEAVSGVTEVAAFGYGAAKIAGGSATVYIVGTVNGSYGIWYSTDDAQTWTKIGEHPLGNLDVITVISGDMDEFGKVYIGFGGKSYAYYNINDLGTSITSSSPAPSTPTTLATIANALDDAHNVTLAAGAVTNDKTPVLKGTLTAALTSGQSLVVYRDGVKIGVAAISGTGWSLTDPGATDGNHAYTVRVESTSGLNGNFSPAFNLKVDATAPTQTVAVASAVDDFGPTTGTLASGAITDDHSPLIKGTLSAALGSDETLVVYRDGVRLGAATVSGSSWTYADSNVADGQHSYVARVEDAAGNQGTAASAFSLQVKSSAPTTTANIKIAVDDFGSMKGNLVSGATTDDTSPLLKGSLTATLASGEQLIVYRDGVRLGAATVSGTDWSYADKGVGKGAHVYTSQVEDSAGGKSPSSAGFYLSVSTQKAVKAAVMSVYSVTTAAVDSTVKTVSDPISKFGLTASQLIDTSTLSATNLTAANQSADASLSLKTVSEPLVSLKHTDALLVTADNEHIGAHLSFSSAGIDLIGDSHAHTAYHWLPA